MQKLAEYKQFSSFESYQNKKSEPTTKDLRQIFHDGPKNVILCTFLNVSSL